MTTRDRLVLAVVAALVVLGAFWMLLVSPERKTASKLSSEVSTASAQLATVRRRTSNALVGAAALLGRLHVGREPRQSGSAERRSAVADLSARAGFEPEERRIQLDHERRKRRLDVLVDSAATPTSAPTGFTQMPFTFVFTGGFSDLYHLFLQLNKATVRTTSGGLQRQRPLADAARRQARTGRRRAPGESSAQKLTGTITATAYVLPAAQGLTAGATPTSPAPAAGAASPASTSTATSASTPAPAATVEPLR